MGHNIQWSDTPVDIVLVSAQGISQWFDVNILALQQMYNGMLVCFFLSNKGTILHKKFSDVHIPSRVHKIKRAQIYKSMLS